MKKLSVIIVTYHSEKDIYDCLSSVWGNCDIPRDDLEVIVVDNSPDSEPMFGELRERYGDGIRLVHNTHNGGYGQGNNVGIRLAEAPLLLIMNPDVRLASPFFRRAVEAFEKDPLLCMYGAKQMQTPTMVSRSSFICSYMMNGYVRTFMEAFCNRLDWYLPRHCCFSGSCFFVNKKKFESVGLFDEDVFMYGEEYDIHCLMMRLHGPHFTYDTRLRYIQTTHDRKPNLQYELTIAKVALRNNEKNGFSKQKSMRSLIAICNCRLWREQLKVRLLHCPPDWRDMLADYRRELGKMSDKLSTHPINAWHQNDIRNYTFVHAPAWHGHRSAVKH